MDIDKDLFLYDVAVVAIMKNEGPYVKEWLDYHILAGVEHFYIYDNESPDNLKEVLQPYINDGLVTYKFYPGKARQYEAYNEAVQEYRFFCRYMAFIDADEFIFPQNNKSVPEVVDEILEKYPSAGGLAVNIFTFGSNFQEHANYREGVLRRFTRRAPTDFCPLMPELNNLPGGTAHVSSIVNPRKVHHFGSPHFAYYLDGYQAVNSNGGVVPLFYNNPPTVDKIVMNHYPVKSKEEYLKKINRGTADNKTNIYNMEVFKKNDHNEVFDDGILRYLATRPMARLENHTSKHNRIHNALLKNLSPFFGKALPSNSFQNKLEMLLMCRKLAEYMRTNAFNDVAGNFFEEISIEAMVGCLSANMRVADFRLLISELPEILKLNYPAVKELHKALIDFIPKVMDLYRRPLIDGWKEFIQLQHLLKMLQLIDLNKK